MLSRRNVSRLTAFLFLWLPLVAIAEGDHRIFNLGNYALESGAVLPDAKLSYITRGELNADKSNAILGPSAYAGDHHTYDFLIGLDNALDPEKYFIITTDTFSNGLSSSPSNTPAPYHGPDFPAISIRDNVNAVHRLLTEQFGIDQLYAIIGFSMGAQQAFQWAVSHPDFMRNVVAYCGTAKEYPHGIVRLEGFKSAIMADATFNNGNYTEKPVVGLKASGRHWAGWGMSQEWYRQENYKQMGHESIEDFLQNFWEAAFVGFDANDLITLAITWQNNNVGDTPGFDGDHEKALRTIKARTLYLACETDMYFPLEALQYEADFIPNVEFVVIPTLWGHLAGGGFSETDNTFLNAKIKDFLQ